MRTFFLAFLYSFFMRGFLKVIVGVKYINKEVLKMPEQFIIVANHNSHLDSISLMAALPWRKIKNVHPVAAGDYFGKSKLKAFFTKQFTNALLIPRTVSLHDKTRDPIQMMLNELTKGKSLIVFPEGSRGEAEKLQKFKRGIGYLLSKYPSVHFLPVFTSGLGKTLPKGERLLIPFNSYVVFGEPTRCTSTDPNEIVKQIESCVLALKEKLPEAAKAKTR